MTELSPDLFQAIPKTELHIHLEGAIPNSLLFEFIERGCGNHTIRRPEDLDEKFRYESLEHFLKIWNWKNQFIRRLDDFTRIAFEVLKKLNTHNVKYAEVFASPSDHTERGLTATGITRALIDGIREAERTLGIRCRLIADLVRNYGAENAMICLDDLTPCLGDTLVGIGLGGGERDGPAELFETVFTEARKRGFRITVHAGEAMGPESIWSALKLLGAERIGHGLTAVRDPELMEYLKTNRIPLECCIISNTKTRVCPSLDRHPVRRFFDAGLMVTVNSDDPVMFGCSIIDEYAVLSREFGFGLDELKQVSMNGIEASFMTDDEKKYFRNVFQQEWDDIRKRFR
ncbi:adenosine deaminase [bacterium]|nr:adenosine deaminase [candidate division CSSED10-310 bacterium]